MLRRLFAGLLATAGLVAPLSAVAQHGAEKPSAAVKKALGTTSFNEYGFAHKIIACVNADRSLYRRLSKSNLKIDDFKSETVSVLMPTKTRYTAVNGVIRNKLEILEPAMKQKLMEDILFYFLDRELDAFQFNRDPGFAKYKRTFIDVCKLSIDLMVIEYAKEVGIYKPPATSVKNGKKTNKLNGNSSDDAHSVCVDAKDYEGCVKYQMQ